MANRAPASADDRLRQRDAVADCSNGRTVGPATPGSTVLGLQTTVGNHAVARLVQGRPYSSKFACSIQAKLMIGAVNDPLEAQADQVAREVLSTTDAEIDQELAYRGGAQGTETQTGHKLSRSVDPVFEENSMGALHRASTITTTISEAFDAGKDFERKLTETRGGGSNLPDNIRSFMEPRFGSDLSAVRIHTDSASAQMNAEIGARAFTYGNNIYFGAGQSPSDLSLTAHELAHVCQQTSSSSHPPCPVSRLTIHAPGSGTGLRTFGAEDDSNVEINPTAAYFVNGVIADSSAFGDAQTITITANPETEGILQMQIPAHIFIDNSMPWPNIEYDESAQVNWPVRVTASGQLQISDAAPVVLQQGGAQTTQLFLGSVDATKGDSYVIATVNIVSNTTHTRTAGVVYQIEQSVGGRTFQRQFRINIRAPRPDPQGSIEVGPIRVARQHNVLFERPGQPGVSGTQEASLLSWYEGLSDATRQRIQAGTEPISLVGHASTTADPQLNRELSNQRMLNVQRILRQYAGSQATIHTRAVGEYQAETGPEIESAEERRVEVLTWEQR